ncbi:MULTISPECIES: lipoprotein [unclassified Spiroplasma]|uniref:lipoprotein n=1 Tax=unclassified Spiroplasma TaxID=2637901 RepID=UPI0030D4D9D1
MKKILSILGTISLTGLGTANSVACKNQFSESDQAYINSFFMSSLFFNVDSTKMAKCSGAEIS